MTNLLLETEAINPRPSDQETPRAATFLRKYSLLDVPADLLENLKNAERGFHMRRQEFDLAVLLRGMAEDHQDACEAALLTAMILAESQAKALDEQEKMAVEEFGRVMKGEKGAGDENTEANRAGLGEEVKAGELQVKGLDPGSGSGKGKGEMGKTWMGMKEEDWGATFLLCILIYVLYKIFF